MSHKTTGGIFAFMRSFPCRATRLDLLQCLFTARQFLTIASTVAVQTKGLGIFIPGPEIVFYSGNEVSDADEGAPTYPFSRSVLRTTAQ